MFDKVELRESKSYKVTKGYASCIITMYNNGKANIMIIDSVETDIDNRRKGFAKELLKMVIETAKMNGVDAIELLVNSSNFPAIYLYTDLGFDCVENKEHWRLILNKWE